MPKISVVMPVYNTGEQLYKTLMSLMSQQESDFEVLMIDDCSTDLLTIETEETFQRFDKRFKLYRQESNIGSAPCRNIGLKLSTGNYLIFLDSDDLFCDNMLKEMAYTLEKSEADVCVSNFMMHDVKNDLKSPIYADEKKGVTDRIFSLSELGENALGFWMPTPWNKMFRRDYVVDNDLEFQDLTNCSDMYFGYMSVLKAKRIVYCREHEPILIYRVNNPKQISFHMDSRNMIRAYVKLFEKMANEEFARKQLMLEFINSLGPMMSRCPNQEINKECKAEAKALAKCFGNNIVFEDEKNNESLKSLLES